MTLFEKDSISYLSLKTSFALLSLEGYLSSNDTEPASITCCRFYFYLSNRINNTEEGRCANIFLGVAIAFGFMLFVSLADLGEVACAEYVFIDLIEF